MKTHKGQVDMKLIAKIVLGLIGLGIMIFIIIPAIRDFGKAIFSTANKYTAPKLDFTNNYGMTAERLDIDISQTTDKCTLTATDATGISTWTCPKGKPQNLNIFIKNNGVKMLTVRGGIVVCKSGEKDCCGTTSTPTSINSDYDCTITPGKEESCSGGTYTFDTTYKEYEVHPIADCIMDATDGCYNAGMTTSVKSCNPNNYIIVRII